MFLYCLFSPIEVSYKVWNNSVWSKSEWNIIDILSDLKTQLQLFPWSWRHETSSINDTKAPVEFCCMSIENWQLFEFFITKLLKKSLETQVWFITYRLIFCFQH